MAYKNEKNQKFQRKKKKSTIESSLIVWQQVEHLREFEVIDIIHKQFSSHEHQQRIGHRAQLHIKIVKRKLDLE